ncbi:MAG: hypothetical protein NT016_03100 [Candidatus Aenigmarchaeota archaeon]|nr:hypothetical protein [Candidatus Aenigmarchaeota archaeon]
MPRDAVQQKASDYVRKLGSVREDALLKHLYEEGVSPADAKRVMVENLMEVREGPYTPKTEPYFFKFPNINSVPTTPWTGYKLLRYDQDVLVEEQHLPRITGLLPPVQGSGLLPPPRHSDGIKIERRKEGRIIDMVTRMYILLK